VLRQTLIKTIMKFKLLILLLSHWQRKLSS